MPKFTYDIKMLATVTVEANSEAHARLLLQDGFDCADCNGGAWPNGDPILFEGSMDGEPDLVTE